MPELPEVETTRRGIEPHLINQMIDSIVIRQRQLRWPVPTNIKTVLKHQTIHHITRRGKYLLLQTKVGTLIIHLGMSGSLRVISTSVHAEKHDHVDIVLSNQQCLRLRDPRRFGAVLFSKTDPLTHKLLRDLGPEPLSDAFHSDYLFQTSRKRKINVKAFIMDSKVVVGVGNIYANEALFMARVHPRRAAGKLTAEQCQKLTQAIKKVLSAAIKAGGTTLRDFTKSDGKPGYFRQSLKIYDKKDQPCPNCKKPITHAVIAQRSTYYCTACQK